MDAATIKRNKERYTAAIDVVEDVVLDALLGTYQDVTGKKPSDRLREALYDAIRFHC